MYKEDLALNDLLWSICHKTQPNQTNYFSFKNEIIYELCVQKIDLDSFYFVQKKNEFRVV